ncbi:MAG: hypothetical protein HRT88_12190 [Lentisphaeraceae bacterium]|nr:hypothetical protein [Lentisphaeraceae bacterium]
MGKSNCRLTENSGNNNQTIQSPLNYNELSYGLDAELKAQNINPHAFSSDLSGILSNDPTGLRTPLLQDNTVDHESKVTKSLLALALNENLSKDKELIAPVNKSISWPYILIALTIVIPVARHFIKNEKRQQQVHK